MKYLLLLLFVGLINFLPKEKLDYSGNWLVSGDNFENKLRLEKIEGRVNVYKFSFNGWRISYDNLAKKNVKFFGEIENEIFVFEIKDNQAVYSDDGREYEEGWSPYNKGEERCKIYFNFAPDLINVKTEACSLIYGGFGVSFDGNYKK